ncbi:DUF1850 domain-containing protein [Nocardiopsis sp. CNT312]|uniref:DUF1850 domain-containing protein n=1 Tax=Nocardiopsis sp. CNT312 TaxID=1137268 RepID=UPI0004B3BEC0|nr:DUF1850 domain-containing protein [Nocardiopsis sp. CNT312]
MAARNETAGRRPTGAGGVPRPSAAALWGGLFVLTAAAALLLWPVWPALGLTDDGEPLGTLPLAEGEVFTISYVHSIDGLPIEENLAVREGRLVAESTRSVQYGAGMGQIPGEGHGYAEGRWWVVEAMDRDVGGEVVLRPGSAAVDHRLRTPGAEVRLSPCLTSHRVVIRPVRVSTLRLLFGQDPRPECPSGADSRPHPERTLRENLRKDHG